jgi:hypothetical protein
VVERYDLQTRCLPALLRLIAPRVNPDDEILSVDNN